MLAVADLIALAVLVVVCVAAVPIITEELVSLVETLTGARRP